MSGTLSPFVLGGEPVRRKMNRVCLLIRCGLFSLIPILVVAPAFAQWEPDVRLTYNDSASYTSNNNAQCVAASGDTVHVVWYDQRDGNREIYYKRSTDGGASWGSDTRLTNGPSFSVYPSVAISGSKVHIVWADDRDGNYEIYYKQSFDGGTTWGFDARLTNDTARSYLPCFAVLDSNVYVVWEDNRAGMFNYEIYYKHSTDEGATWSSDTRLTNASGFSGYPSVAGSDSIVHVVWEDRRDGNDEIYYKRSTDRGITWGSDTCLTNDPTPSDYPSIAVYDSNVHIVWVDGRDTSGYPEIYYKRSSDRGTTWGPDTRLTYDPNTSWEPSISASRSLVHVVWSEGRNGSFEIYYKRSPDHGSTWEPDSRLTNDPDTSRGPHIAVSGSRVNVVWRDHRIGNNEIYYKRNPTGNSGIEGDKGQRFGEAKVQTIRANPNPFTSFNTIPGREGDRFVLYDISGKLVGTYKGYRIGADLSPGVYFVKSAMHRSSVQKIVKIR